MRPARILSFIFIFLLSFFAFKTAVFAQTTPLNTDPNVPNNLHTVTQNVMIEVTSSLTCLLAGVDAANPGAKCLGIDPQTHKIGYVENSGGAIGVMGNLIAMTFTPPIHTGDYIAYLGNNFGIAKGAYAANAPNGIGFEGISPLINVWIAFRNLTYLLFVLVFIIIGFAIMLRVHIDPRTVMTIENQIPKIIIALILVTFSFAIAGFLLDIMYLGIYLVANIFGQIDKQIADSINQVVSATNPIQAANSLASGVGGIGNISQKGAEATGAFFGGIFDNLFGRIIVGGIMGFLGNMGIDRLADTVGILKFAGASTIYGIIGTTLAKGIATVISAGAGGLLAPQIMGFVGGIIAFLVIIIAILFALFKLWFTLLQAYVFLLIDIVFAPFWIIAGLLPGSNLTFVSWLRETGAEIIAFPATIVMFLLGKLFIDEFANVDNPFVPPLIANPAGHVIGNFIGLGIILMTPNVVNMMKGWLKAPRFDITAITAAIGVGAGALTTTPRQALGLGSALRAAQLTKGGGLLERYRAFEGELRFPGTRQH